jgi:hypothetical protein
MSAQSLEDLRRVAHRFQIGSLNLRYAVALGLNDNPTGAALEMQVIQGMYGQAHYQRGIATFHAHLKKTTHN